jgi:spore coat protein CotF
MDIKSRLASQKLEGLKMNQKAQMLNKIVEKMVERVVTQTENTKNKGVSEATLQLAKESEKNLSWKCKNL